MLNDLKVKVGPEFYQYSDDAMKFVDPILESYQAQNILLVHGSISYDKAKPYLTFLENTEKSYFFHQYTGECSYYGVDLIKEKVKEHNIQFVIGVGGGKLADLVGLAANQLNLPFGVIPTLASNCAPWTPLSIMYTESGESEGKSEHYYHQAAFFLTVPALVVDAPVDYFIAGIADTLAKWYESEAILLQDSLKDEPFLKLAKYTALISKDILYNEGSKAIEDMKQGIVSEEFKHCSEIIFGIAGLVGGFGDKYARNAIAHANHDAISKYLPGSHNFLHGEKVAYGILYQLAVEDKWSVIDELLKYYQELKLPNSLTYMDIYPMSEEDLDKVVDFMYSKEKVHLVPIEITKDLLRNKLIELEEYVSHKQ